jgi:hypothetical protein
MGHVFAFGRSPGDSLSAAATAGAATCNSVSGKITSEALTTAADAEYVLTLTNSLITASSMVFASVANGTNTTEGIVVQRVQPGSSSVVIRVKNTNAGALNGTIVVSFMVL